jgi:hypothetical protein
MSYHVHKNEIQLTWMDNRDVVKNGLRSIVRRIENEMLCKLDEEYSDAINGGEIVRLVPGSAELTQLFKDAVELAFPDDSLPAIAPLKEASDDAA